MSLKKISIKLADEIIKIYSDIILEGEKLNINKYPYSAFKGYDVFDFENALKLLTAYRVYTTQDMTENNYSTLYKYSREDNAAIFSYFNFFIPNHIYKELLKYPYGSSDYRQKEFELLYDKDNLIELKKFMERSSETVDSFLDFCIKLHKDDYGYWQKVFSRLNLEYNEEDIFVKYLQFINQRRISPLGDYFQINFTYVLKDSIQQDQNQDEKSISIRISGREDASLRAQYKNYELESAFFTIAKNYILNKISAKFDLKDKEELFLDAIKYLDLEMLDDFHNDDIRSEILN